MFDCNSVWNSTLPHRLVQTEGSECAACAGFSSFTGRIIEVSPTPRPPPGVLHVRRSQLMFVPVCGGRHVQWRKFCGRKTFSIYWYVTSKTLVRFTRLFMEDWLKQWQRRTAFSNMKMYFYDVKNPWYAIKVTCKSIIWIFNVTLSCSSLSWNWPCFSRRFDSQTSVIDGGTLC